MNFFECVSLSFKALILFVFWVVGGLIIFSSGISIAIGFNSYFIEIPILANASGIIGITIAFIGLLMIGYGYRHTRCFSDSETR